LLSCQQQSVDLLNQTTKQNSNTIDSFYCEKFPKTPNTVRMCYNSSKYVTKNGYFKKEFAYCYFRSGITIDGGLKWSEDHIRAICFPSIKECETDRDNAGPRWNPIPYKSDFCIESKYDEIEVDKQVNTLDYFK